MMNKNLLRSFLFLSLLIIGNLAWAQNIAFVSINLNPDGFQWVALEDLPVGTVINFTDNGIASTGTSFEADGEGLATYTVTGSTLACGTVVTGTTGTMALANANDQVTAYAGTLASPTILASISTSTWITTGTTSSQTSYAPASGNGVNPTTTNSAVYNGTTSGGAATVQVALTNAANFTTSASAGTFMGTFSLTGCNTFVLPIELNTFKSTLVGNNVLLSFSTATEHNNNYFSIERSQDGTRFDVIGKVTGAGTSTEKQNYTFTDERPVKGINFYRLKQVDFDGQFSYSSVVSVNIGKVGGVRLSPQPVADQLQVALEQPAVDAAVWQVYDFGGRLLQSGTLEAESTNFEISTATLAEGTYVLRLVNGQQIITQQFQKN